MAAKDLALRWPSFAMLAGLAALTYLKGSLDINLCTLAKSLEVIVCVLVERENFVEG